MDALNIRSKLRSILNKAEAMIENGDCDSCPDDRIATLMDMIIPETMGRESAAKYLGISLNRFHDLVNSGKLTAKKTAGFKEKSYRLEDLKKVKENTLI